MSDGLDREEKKLRYRHVSPGLLAVEETDIDPIRIVFRRNVREGSECLSCLKFIMVSRCVTGTQNGSVPTSVHSPPFDIEPESSTMITVLYFFSVSNASSIVFCRIGRRKYSARSSKVIGWLAPDRPGDDDTNVAALASELADGKPTLLTGRRRNGLLLRGTSCERDRCPRPCVGTARKDWSESASEYDGGGGGSSEPVCEMRESGRWLLTEPTRADLLRRWVCEPEGTARFCELLWTFGTAEVARRLREAPSCFLSPSGEGPEMDSELNAELGALDDELPMFGVVVLGV